MQNKMLSQIQLPEKYFVLFILLKFHTKKGINRKTKGTILLEILVLINL